jgi:hypothetical protein
MLHWFNRSAGLLVEVDGTLPIEEVTKQLLAAIQ